MGRESRGLVIGGRYGELVVRQKSGGPFEIGELLVAEDREKKVLVQVYDLLFGSQVSAQNRELLGGMALEEDLRVELLDESLRQYTLALAKELLQLAQKPTLAKALPGFFSPLRDVNEQDVPFLVREGLVVGKLRSGSRVLDVPVALPIDDVLSHHVLIPATTGRGKSNLLKVMLWSLVGKAGILVLDPHDEYYRPEKSLRAHPDRDRIHYYSTDPLPGASTLAINLRQLVPRHFDGAADWSGPQKEALTAYHREYGAEWIEAIVLEKPLPYKYNEATLGVLRRRIMNLLDLELSDATLITEGVFKLNAGETTITDIVDRLERAETVILDTSGFAGSTEILVGSIFAGETFSRRRRTKTKGDLSSRPVIAVVLEEAPRVLGSEVLEQGPNIFSTIAREGRKFRVGLVAITQLPSLIPRSVLANLTTKIILGLEMGPERQAIIESASQDLSRDDRAIASLDRGEAIISTTFAPFAIPVKIPLFDDMVAAVRAAPAVPKTYQGLKR